MCLKRVHRLMTALYKSYVMAEWHNIMKNTSTNKLMNGKFYLILFIFGEFANRFVALRKI